MSKRYTLSHWGLYEVERDAAGVPDLAPFSRDPDPSPIGQGQLSPQMAALRITRPAVRRSWLDNAGRAPERRGLDPFVELEWDEALDLAASEIARVREQFGNRSIFGGSYGWSSAGRFHHAQSQVHRFLNAAGGYVRHVDSYSLGAANVILPHVVAPMDQLMAEHSSWDTLAAHTRLFVSFGGIPVKNSQMNAGGVGIHHTPAALRTLVDAGVRIVNIGPVGDNVGAISGQVEWIPCRPNTDTAVMLAMAQVLLSENLHDRAFLERCCTGFDRFAPYLTGESDGQPKTPAWAEQISGVPAATIARLARDMAATRSMLNVSWAMQRAEHGEQPFWMVVVLAAMMGQIGQPGGGFGVGYGAANLLGSPHIRSKGPTLPQGRNGVTDFIPVARLADMLLGPGESFTYNGETYQYPDIRLVYWAGGNPFHHHQDLNRLRLAWARPETIIVNDPWWSPAARRADIVFPATTTLERNDIGSSTLEAFIVAMRAVESPAGSARDDYDIFAGLARRLGCEADYTEGLDTMGWLQRLYAEARQINKGLGIELPEFDEFWQSGLVDMTAHDRPATMLHDFVAQPAQRPLNTPSGRIEIWSDRIAEMALADCPPHPVWLEKREWLGSAGAAQYPLHLLTDQPARKLHSQLDASPHSMSGKVEGREQVHLHPSEVEQRGLHDGQIVEIFNGRGRCLAAVCENSQIMPRVARLNTGAWYDPCPDTALDRHGNPNVLTRDIAASSLSQGCAAQSCLVEIRAWEGPLPDIEAFQLPQRHSR
jgi:biotin/methionine sulfoxide reductase